MMDFGTKERKQFIDNISPFHRDESFAPYLFAWIGALCFGAPMPHERRMPAAWIGRQS